MKDGIWTWLQPHCACGWIGIEVSVGDPEEDNTAHLEAMIASLAEHRESHA